MPEISILIESGSNLVRNLAKRISPVTASSYSITKYARDPDTQDETDSFLSYLQVNVRVYAVLVSIVERLQQRDARYLCSVRFYIWSLRQRYYDLSDEITWFAEYTRIEGIESNE